MHAGMRVRTYVRSIVDACSGRRWMWVLSCCVLGGALEAGGDVLAAVVDEEAEVDGHVEVDAKDVGLERRAEAHRRLQVGEPLDQRAARLLRRRAQLQVDQPVEHVGAHAQLQRVDRAPREPA